MKKTRLERKVEIARIMQFLGEEKGYTMRQIAFWIGLSPSSHLLGILKSMKDDGLLDVSAEKHRTHAKKFVWKLTSKGSEMADIHTQMAMDEFMEVRYTLTDLGKSVL